MEGGSAMLLRNDCLRMLGCFACLLAFSPDAMAAETAAPDLVSVRQENAENLLRLQQHLTAQRDAGIPLSVSLVDELSVWRQIELVVMQREAVLDAMRVASQPTVAETTSNGEISRFLELEDARDSLAVTRRNFESLELELQAEQSLMLQTRELLQEAEQDRRRTTENLLSASADSRLSLQNQQRLEAVRVRLLEQQHFLHRDTIAEMTQRKDRIESTIVDHSDRIERAGRKIVLSKGEVEQQLGRIADMESTIRQQLSELDQQMHLVLVSPERDPSASTKLEVIREESQLLRQLMTEMAAIRVCWKRRYQFSHRAASEEEWATWRDEARQAENRLAQIHVRLASRTMQRRQQVAAIRRQSVSGDQLGGDPSPELAQFEAIIDAYGNLQVLAARGQRLYARFAEDLEARQGQYSFGQWTLWVGNRIRACWQYELTAVDDRSITVGKLVIAFLLLIVGVIISKVISAVVAFRVLPRFGFSHAASSTIRQIMMYGLIVAMTMLSLSMANVPLTIFAFLGGAAAIGVGFGSQNAVANFISGLILLIQRPIRIGDLINADGIDANVEHIGARATRVRTTENVEVLIPNSNILHNNVTNWTLSDTQIRTNVTVGVAYGTPVRPVFEALQHVVAEHSKVIDEPDPIVLFEDFGDSSLVFTVHFWIHMRTIMDGAVIRSEIRVAIDDAFRRAGIVIAFPQRDVHIDLQSPIEVALTDRQRSVSRPMRRAA
jgi:potassium efflux system protein